MPGKRRLVPRLHPHHAYTKLLREDYHGTDMGKVNVKKKSRRTDHQDEMGEIAQRSIT